MIYADYNHFMGDFTNCEPLRRILTFLWEKGPTLADGIYDLGTDGVYVQVKSHEPQPFAARRYETHIKHADVQMILEGEEQEYVQILSDDMKVVEDKLEESDVRFHADPAKPGVAVTLRPGLFALFMPEDAHKTEVATTPMKVRKAIGKIPVGLLKF